MGGSIVLARRVHLVAAWLFVVAVIVQVFLIGLYLFAGGSLENHRSFGYSILFVALAVLLSALWARVPRRDALATVGLLVLYFVQTSLPEFKTSAPAVAALHPVVALLLFWLGLQVARRARELHAASLVAPTATPVSQAATGEVR